MSEIINWRPLLGGGCEYPLDIHLQVVWTIPEVSTLPFKTGQEQSR